MSSVVVKFRYLGISTILLVVLIFSGCASGGVSPSGPDGGMDVGVDVEDDTNQGTCSNPRSLCQVNGSQECVNTSTDATHCGGCGNMCAVGEACNNGTCGCPSGQVECGGQCVDTTSDAAHCGGCGNACSAGNVCNNGTCGCPSGFVECDGLCVDTASNAAHCGSCGNACPMGSSCSASMCVCPSGTTACGNDCVNTDIRIDHCGGCGNMCASTQTCVAGMCEGSVCMPGQLECGGTCINPNTDTANCGGCGNVCGASQICDVGMCRPRNDLRANAEVLSVPSGAELSVVGSTVGATVDVPTVPCNSSGPNVWYRIQLTEGGVLWVDTAGSAYDTSIIVTDSSGTPVSDMCDDDCGCGSRGDFGALDSCVGKFLSAGTYYISVGGAGSSTGNFILHVQFLPGSVGSFVYGTPLVGMGVTSQTRLIGTSSASTMVCGSLTNRSGEDVRWFAACGDSRNVLLSVCPQDGGSWEGTSCDPVLYVRSGQTGAEITCNDDGGGSCQPVGGGSNFGSRITGFSSVPRGIGAVFIDNRGSGTSMQYQLSYSTDNILR